MVNLSQYEIAGSVWAIETPSERVCSLTILVSKTYNEKTTESYLTVKLFGGLKDKAMEQCEPGSHVRVTGEIKSREYQGRHYPEFIVNNLFCTPVKKETTTESHPATEPDDDLPF